MLEQDEHGATLRLYYLHVKCSLHLSRILAGEGVTLTRNLAYILVNNIYTAPWVAIPLVELKATCPSRAGAWNSGKMQ